ncbi:MAG: YkgJ family cysteine cluster protein [Candidatus Omnitrophica bacterium]|nr:YkgJ family cysteine cluster protein [Candidatus Omnitrophota bacterium]MCM8770994.1 YkgJ family cysteine cluster protein [Candidatus Omnitrophota bacterium]
MNRRKEHFFKIYDLKQFIPKNFCLNCQGCCRYANIRSKWSPFLLNEEIELFKKKKIPVSLRPHTKKIKLIRLLSASREVVCPFLEVFSNRCKIYNLRPFDCRLYPFLLRKIKNKIYLAIDTNCPYVQKTFRQEEFNNYVDRLARFLKQPKIKKLIQCNPRIIGFFPEKEVVNLLCLSF